MGRQPPEEEFIAPPCTPELRPLNPTAQRHPHVSINVHQLYGSSLPREQPSDTAQPIINQHATHQQQNTPFPHSESSIHSRPSYLPMNYHSPHPQMINELANPHHDYQAATISFHSSPNHLHSLRPAHSSNYHRLPLPRPPSERPHHQYQQLQSQQHGPLPQLFEPSMRPRSIPSSQYTQPQPMSSAPIGALQNGEIIPLHLLQIGGSSILPVHPGRPVQNQMSGNRPVREIGNIQSPTCTQHQIRTQIPILNYRSVGYLPQQRPSPHIRSLNQQYPQAQYLNSNFQRPLVQNLPSDIQQEKKYVEQSNNPGFQQHQLRTIQSTHLDNEYQKESSAQRESSGREKGASLIEQQPDSEIEYQQSTIAASLDNQEKKSDINLIPDTQYQESPSAYVASSSQHQQSSLIQINTKLPAEPKKTRKSISGVFTSIFSGKKSPVPAQSSYDIKGKAIIEADIAKEEKQSNFDRLQTDRVLNMENQNQIASLSNKLPDRIAAPFPEMQQSNSPKMILSSISPLNISQSSSVEANSSIAPSPTSPEDIQPLPVLYSPGASFGRSMSLPNSDVSHIKLSSVHRGSYDQNIRSLPLPQEDISEIIPHSEEGAQLSNHSNQKNNFPQYSNAQFAQQNSHVASERTSRLGSFSNFTNTEPQGSYPDFPLPVASLRDGSISSKGSISDSLYATPTEIVKNLPETSLSDPNGRNLEEYRELAKKSTDSEFQFAFARHLIDLAQSLKPTQFIDSKGVRKNQELLHHEALKVLKKLVTQGKYAYPQAQFFLAECYGNGSLGLTIDNAKAYQLYISASKQSHPASTYRCAVCYEVGAGTKRDNQKAAQFYRKASALGDTAAMYKLGMILKNGTLGQSKNPRECLIWLKRAARQADSTNPHALHELGLLYEGKSPDMENLLIPDISYAFNLFDRAAQMGYAPSQYKLGVAYEYGGLGRSIDPSKSLNWYTKAADQGDQEAELALSGWYLTGAEQMLAQSDSNAFYWAKRAADKGLAKAQYAVGYYMENGIGTKIDLQAAKIWYNKAATQGNKRALQKLKELQ